MNFDKKRAVIKEHLMVYKNKIMLFIKPKPIPPPPEDYTKIFNKPFSNNEILKEILPMPNPYECEKCGLPLQLASDGRYGCAKCGIESDSAHLYDLLFRPKPTRTEIETKELGIKEKEEETFLL